MNPHTVWTEVPFDTLLCSHVLSSKAYRRVLGMTGIKLAAYRPWLLSVARFDTLR